MTFMFHQSNKREFVCHLPGLIHGPSKTLLVLSSNNERMSQSLVAWSLPGNHSSANNRAPLNPCSVHVCCPLSCPTSLSQWVIWAEPYTAWKRPTKSEQTFVPTAHVCWAVGLRKGKMFLPGRHDGCQGSLIQIHRKRLAQRNCT